MIGYNPRTTSFPRLTTALPCSVDRKTVYWAKWNTVYAPRQVLRLVSILNIATTNILPLAASVPMIPELRYGNIEAHVERERTSEDGGNENTVALNYRIVESVGKSHGV